MFSILVHPGRILSDRELPALVRPGLFPHADHSLQSDWRGDNALIVSSGDPSSRKSPRVAHCRDTGIVCAIWGRIHNREEIAARLGADYASDAAMALAAYRKWGRDCGEKLAGEFALAFHDPRDNSLVAIRDALGIRPLYYALRDGELAVATSIPALRGLAGGYDDIDPQWMARFVCGTSMSREATPYEGIRKVPPGHFLKFDASGLELQRYHRFDPDAPLADHRDPARVDEYRAVLEETIRCRLESPDPIGVETSGGIDSSTIAGFAPGLVKDPDIMLHGFGFIAAEKEPDAVLGVSRFAGLRNNHLFVRSGAARQEDAAERAMEVLGHPAEHGNCVGHVPFYKLGRTLGIRSLLSGFGGDEGVTNYAVNHRRDLLVSGQNKALWQLLRGNPLSKSLRMAKALRLHRHYPEFAPNLLKGARKRIQQNVLTDDVTASLGIEAELLDTARWQYAYETLNGFAIGMLEKPFVSTRTESCSLLAAAYGIEYHWPLLDSRLIAQWLATPTIEKASKDMGRYLHRRAIAGKVPDTVRLQVSKYMGSPLAMQGQDDVGDPRDVQRISDGLHPALESIIDRKRLQKAVNIATAGQEDSKRSPSARSLRSIASLDHWLRSRHSREDRA